MQEKRKKKNTSSFFLFPLDKEADSFDIILETIPTNYKAIFAVNITHIRLPKSSMLNFRSNLWTWTISEVKLFQER